MKKLFGKYILFGVVITLLAGMIYITSQQILRQSANDPQIQIAEDFSTRLETVPQPPKIPAIDVAKSLSPFIIVYDKSGQIISSSVVLNNKTPQLPLGIFPI